MSFKADVYVFVSGWSDLIGLSLDHRAANLPPSLPDKWTIIDKIPLAAHEIGLLRVDPTIAIENLRTRDITLRSHCGAVRRIPNANIERVQPERSNQTISSAGSVGHG